MDASGIASSTAIDEWTPADPRTLSTVTVHGRSDVETARTPARPENRARRAIRDTGYVLAAFPVSIAAVPIVWALFGAGLGLAVTVVGLPILALCGRVARGFAVLRRRMIRTTLHRAAPSPVYRRSERGFVRRALYTLSDGQTWLDILHGMFSILTATVAFSVVVAWWTTALAGLSWLLWSWSLPTEGNVSLPELIGLSGDRLFVAGFYFVLGLFFLLTLPTVVRAMVWIDAGPALLLLSGRAELQQEIRYQVQGREAARTAESGSLRRLERDIHDGPQQRLVRLGMDLGRARRQLDTDPARA